MIVLLEVPIRTHFSVDKTSRKKVASHLASNQFVQRFSLERDKAPNSFRLQKQKFFLITLTF